MQLQIYDYILKINNSKTIKKKTTIKKITYKALEHKNLTN